MGVFVCVLPYCLRRTFTGWPFEIKSWMPFLWSQIATTTTATNDNDGLSNSDFSNDIYGYLILFWIRISHKHLCVCICAAASGRQHGYLKIAHLHSVWVYALALASSTRTITIFVQKPFCHLKTNERRNERSEREKIWYVREMHCVLASVLYDIIAHFMHMGSRRAQKPNKL